jgi:hypothetical protein
MNSRIRLVFIGLAILTFIAFAILDAAFTPLGY